MTKKPPAPSDTADKFMLRLPDGMRDRLKEEAAKNKRSLNAEIVARLDESFEIAKTLPVVSGALDSLEDSIRQNREMVDVSRAVLTEVKGLRAVIRYLAESEDQPDAELKDLLKTMVKSAPGPEGEGQ